MKNKEMIQDIGNCLDIDPGTAAIVYRLMYDCPRGKVLDRFASMLDYQPYSDFSRVNDERMKALKLINEIAGGYGIGGYSCDDHHFNYMMVADSYDTTVCFWTNGYEGLLLSSWPEMVKEAEQLAYGDNPRCPSCNGFSADHHRNEYGCVGECRRVFFHDHGKSHYGSNERMPGYSEYGQPWVRVQYDDSDLIVHLYYMGRSSYNKKKYHYAIFNDLDNTLITAGKGYEPSPFIEGDPVKCAGVLCDILICLGDQDGGDLGNDQLEELKAFEYEIGEMRGEH